MRDPALRDRTRAVGGWPTVALAATLIAVGVWGLTLSDSEAPDRSVRSQAERPTGTANVDAPAEEAGRAPQANSGGERAGRRVTQGEVGNGADADASPDRTTPQSGGGGATGIPLQLEDLLAGDGGGSNRESPQKLDRRVRELLAPDQAGGSSGPTLEDLLDQAAANGG